MKLHGGFQKFFKRFTGTLLAILLLIGLQTGEISVIAKAFASEPTQIAQAIKGNGYAYVLTNEDEVGVYLDYAMHDVQRNDTLKGKNIILYATEYVDRDSKSAALLVWFTDDGHRRSGYVSEKRLKPEPISLADVMDRISMEGIEISARIGADDNPLFPVSYPLREDQIDIKSTNPAPMTVCSDMGAQYEAVISLEEDPSIRIRKTAEQNSAVNGYGAHGETVCVLQVNDDWAFIRTAGGIEGYVRVRYLKKVEAPSAKPSETPSDGAQGGSFMPVVPTNVPNYYLAIGEAVPFDGRDTTRIYSFIGTDGIPYFRVYGSIDGMDGYFASDESGALVQPFQRIDLVEEKDSIASGRPSISTHGLANFSMQQPVEAPEVPGYYDRLSAGGDTEVYGFTGRDGNQYYRIYATNHKRSTGFFTCDQYGENAEGDPLDLSEEYASLAPIEYAMMETPVPFDDMTRASMDPIIFCYQWQHEPVLFGWLPNGKHRWFSDRKQSTIWNFDKPKRSEQHPTMKPVPLLAYPIRNSSAPNGIVLDLFGGSGSTLIACEQLDRVCYTMELDPKYATVIVLRAMEQFGATAGIKVLRGGVERSYEDVTAELTAPGV